MSYTKKNLAELDDVAAGAGFGEVQEARFARGDLRAEDTGLAYHVIRPGKRQFAHRHKNAEEIVVVLSGGGRAKLDDELVDLEPMDALRLAPDTVRAFEAGDEGLELLVFGPHHDKDAEIVKEDVWGDD
jgi:quercetin dioxygenase-like cupin family protein